MLICSLSIRKQPGQNIISGCIWEREGIHYLIGLNAPLLFPPPEKLPRVKISQEINSHSLVLTMCKGDDAPSWHGWVGRGQQHSSSPTCATTRATFKRVFCIIIFIDMEIFLLSGGRLSLEVGGVRYCCQIGSETDTHV